MTPNSPLKRDAAVKVATHASEGGHFYDKSANQILEVMKVDGSGYTKCTLAHARKLDLGPGCTTPIKQLDKPQLNLWGKRQAIMAALTCPRRDSDTEKEWLARVEEDMEATAKAAREEGSCIHKAVEKCVAGEPFDPTYGRHVEAAIRELDRVCGKQTWSAEHSVVSRCGYGTKIDMLSDEWVINWKSKDGNQAALDKMELWKEQTIQLAAERRAAEDFFVGTGRVRRKCAIGLISRDYPGACRIIGAAEKDLERGWHRFKALLAFWFIDNDYRPSWASES